MLTLDPLNKLHSDMVKHLKLPVDANYLNIFGVLYLCLYLFYFLI